MKGFTYLKRRGFSINEGEYPNIHISWYNHFVFYFAWSRSFRLVYTRGKLRFR